MEGDRPPWGGQGSDGGVPPIPGNPVKPCSFLFSDLSKKAGNMMEGKKLGMINPISHL